MLVIHGVGLYGKVDRVPGLFHVATQFLHIYWMPIIPLRTYLVLEGARPREGFHGLAIPLSWKSILLAWGRLALVVGGCLILPGVAVASVPNHPNAQGKAVALLALVVPFLSLGFLALSYRRRWARPERALELAARAGIPPEVVAERFVDRLQPEDEERLSNIQAEQTDPHSHSF